MLDLARIAGVRVQKGMPALRCSPRGVGSYFTGLVRSHSNRNRGRVLVDMLRFISCSYITQGSVSIAAAVGVLVL